MYYNDVEFELPKKTMALNKKIDAVNNATTTEKVYISMLEFVSLGLGKEKVEEILGTSDINKVDLLQLTMLYNSIIMEYENIVQKPQLERVNDLLKQLQLDKLVELTSLKK